MDDLTFTGVDVSTDIKDWKLVRSGRLEAVGLIPNDIEIALDSGSSQVDSSLAAIALFKRVQLKDDSGSFRNMVEELFGAEAARDVFSDRDGSVSLFAIDGLAEAPNQIPELSVRLLLAEIDKWAQIERALVVVPEHAVRSADGTDLSGYYTRLGFSKVLNMDDLSYVLLYSGSPAPVADASPGSDSDHDLVMIELSPWGRRSG